MIENVLTASAMAFELGVPIALAVGWWRTPSRRPLFASVLVAISPFLLLYTWVTIGYLTGSGDASWAFAAMWVMTFIPFLLFLGVGISIGFARMPRG